MRERVMAAAVVPTVTALVPNDNRIDRWTTDADVSRELARRWDRLHWVRVAPLAGSAFWLTGG